jgi:hypothetical protein
MDEDDREAVLPHPAPPGMARAWIAVKHGDVTQCVNTAVYMTLVPVSQLGSPRNMT